MKLSTIFTLSYWSPQRGAILIGFILTILGSAGSQFFLDPPQNLSRDFDQRSKDIAADIDTLKSAQAQYLMFQQQGALIYALNASGVSAPQGNQREVVGNLYQLSLIDRATAMRTIIGQLAFARLVDFPAMSKSYGDLIDAARADFSLATYTRVDDFEKAVMKQASGLMANLQTGYVASVRGKSQADAVADQRKLILLVLVTLGSTFLLLANLLSTRENEEESVERDTEGRDMTIDLTTAEQIIGAALEHAQRLNNRPRG